MLHQNWQQKLEFSFARYDAGTGRLVQYGEVRARRIGWWPVSWSGVGKEALHEEVRLKQEYEQFCAEASGQAVGGSPRREQIRQLAQDIPKIWLAETTIWLRTGND